MKSIILGAVFTLFVAAVVYYGFLFVPRFFAEKGSIKERAIAAGEGSLTVFTAKITSFFASIIGSIMSYLAVADVADLKATIAQYVKTEYVLGAVVVVMFLVQLARKRKGGGSQVF